MRAGACAVQAARARRPDADRRRGRMDPRTGRTLSTNRNGRLAMLHIARLIEHRFPNLLVKPAKVLVAASALLAALGITRARSEEHTSELQSLMRISYAVFCLKKKTTDNPSSTYQQTQE